MEDIVKYAIFSTKPSTGDLYVIDNSDDIFKCHDRNENETTLGWAGNNPRKVVPCLLNTQLNLEQLDILKKFVWNNHIKDGEKINVTIGFNKYGI